MGKQNQNSGNQNSGKRNNLVGKKNKIVAKKKHGRTKLVLAVLDRRRNQAGPELPCSCLDSRTTRFLGLHMSCSGIPCWVRKVAVRDSDSEFIRGIRNIEEASSDQQRQRSDLVS